MDLSVALCAQGAGQPRQQHSPGHASQSGHKGLVKRRDDFRSRLGQLSTRQGQLHVPQTGQEVRLREYRKREHLRHDSPPHHTAGLADCRTRDLPVRGVSSRLGTSFLAWSLSATLLWQVCCQELSSAGLKPSKLLPWQSACSSPARNFTGRGSRRVLHAEMQHIAFAGCRGCLKCLLYDRLIHRGYHDAPGPAVDLCDLLGA